MAEQFKLHNETAFGLLTSEEFRAACGEVVNATTVEVSEHYRLVPEDAIEGSAILGMD